MAAGFVAAVRRRGAAGGQSADRLGLEPGQPVAVLGFNRPEWVIFDVAAMAAGGAPAGIYTTSPDEVAYVLNHSEAPVVLVENEHQWKKIEAPRRSHHLRHVVVMKGAPIIEDKLVMSWDEFMARAPRSTTPFEQRLEALEPGGLASLIYTSGTTGPPKAVMLSHDNPTWTAGQAIPAIGIGPTDRILSYLPLSHIAEQQFTIAAPALSGAQVFYAESITLADNLKEVRPTIFFAAPCGRSSTPGSASGWPRPTGPRRRSPIGHNRSGRESTPPGGSANRSVASSRCSTGCSTGSSLQDQGGDRAG